MNNFLAHFNWADYFILSVIVLSTVISVARGFVKEAMSLFTWAVAILIGMKFSPQLADLNFMNELIKTPSLRHIVAFLTLFFAVIILGGMINFLISTVVQKTGLGGFNRLVGMVFGFARGVLLVGVLILLAKHTAIPQDPWWSKTTLIPTFEPVANTIDRLMPANLQQSNLVSKPATTKG